MTQSNFGTAGFLKHHSLSNEYESTAFPIQRILSQQNNVMPVSVKDCYRKDGRIFVDIQVIIKQIDADGHGHSNTTIFEIPYLPLAGGGFSIEIEPQAGDVGLAVFCDRDISSFKETFSESLPPSRRKNHSGDAIYLGAFAVPNPDFLIKANFSEKRWDIVGDVNITGNLTASKNLDIGGNADVKGNTSADGDISSGGSIKDGEGITLGTHTHTSGAPGSPTSPPVP